MDANWWPTALAHISSEAPLADEDVVVAEMKPLPGDGHRDGMRQTFSVLIPLADLDAVSQNLGKLGHEVSTSGPHPIPEAAGAYKPKFWIDGRELPSERYEPLVLAWRAHNTTTFAPDPGFLMTYGLAPRLADNITHYDDPTGPLHDVVCVAGPSVYSAPDLTAAYVTIKRDHLQDYLSLRGMVLAQVYYAIAWAKLDDDAKKALGDNRDAEFTFADRLMTLSKHDGDGLVAQVWGARIIAHPGPLPISDDPLDTNGLVWPGIEGPVTNERSQRFRIGDFAYIDDAVLGRYEGVEGFRVSPTSGGVSFGAQWSVGFVRRIGRNTLEAEIKKLYEGAPPSVIQHWHRFAVEPPTDLAVAAKAPNIAIRAKAIVDAMLDLGDQLNALAARLGDASLAPRDFVTFDRSVLNYEGWWTPPTIEPISRHVPLALTRDAFLDRCKGLNKVAVEALAEKRLRRLCQALKSPDADLNNWGSLKLLDLIIRLCLTASTTGLDLVASPGDVRDRLNTNETDPARPIPHLFALYDLRTLGAHADPNPAAKLNTELKRFKIDASANVAGHGASLDKVYDMVAADLQFAGAAIEGALN